MDPRHKSRAILDGPDRAPARAMLQGHRPHRRGPRQAARRRRQHLDRDDALQLPPAAAGGEGQGGHPRRRRHADRVQHRRRLRRHHHGHRGHEGLAGQPRGDRRLDRAGGARPPLRRRRRAVGLRQDDPRHRSWRWPGSTSRALMLYGGSIVPGRFRGPRRDHPGRLRGRRRPRRRARSTASELRALEDAACPGAGRLRRAVHGQHDGAWPFELLGISPIGTASVPGDGPAQGRGRVRRAASWSWTLLQRASRPRQIITRAGARERHRRRRRHGRLDQRRAAPAGDRPRGRRRAGHRRLRPDQRRTPLLADLKPGGRFVAADLYQAGGMARRRPAAARGRPAPRRRARRSPAGRSARRRGAARETPGQEVVRPLARAAQAARRPGDPARATSRPRAAWSRWRATSACSTAGRPRVFDREEDAFAAVQGRARSRPATWWSSATRARRAGRACARCSASPRRSSARASASRSRCSPTAASPAPPAA